MQQDILLQTAGSQITTRSGRPVLLRGVGLGGWMNMESFITGYPATESLQRKALRKALGEEGYRTFFDRFLDVFFAEADAAFLAALGMNLVRVPINYRHFEDDMRPFELKQEGFELLDRAIERCARHGIYTIIDLHAAPGFQNQHWHSDNPTHWAFFWQHKHFQDRVVNLWEALASRYRDNPWVAGYNALNEPADASGETIGPFYRRLHDAVRAIDPDHILFLDANRYSLDFGIFDEVWPNTVYTVHDYALPGFVYGDGYPGVTRGKYVDRSVLEETFLARSEFMRQTETPIYVGEFGPVYLGDEAADEMRYQLLADQLELYRRYDAGWAIWTYKDIGLQGLVYADAESPYMQRVRDVVAKKARLGADQWGSRDDGVRKVMEPIEQLFEREFPDYEPFPFGAEQWAQRIVRFIMLAEPLVQEFGRCFEGVRGTEAIHALADSFKLENCLMRSRLLDILKDAVAAPGGAAVA
ncbi:MAG: glycoside hydrolase family 5 protein [Gaiellaceae bacterium]